MNRKMKISKGDIPFFTITYTFLLFALVITLYPLIFVASASLSNPIAVNQGRVWLFPQDITFEGYQRVFKNIELLIGYRNTIFYTVAGTLLNLAVTFAAAYPLARKDFIGRNLFTFFFTFTMFFSGGLIPTYMVVKDLGMLDTVWSMIILGAVSMWNIILVRTYMQTSIPVEIQESAFVDGGSNFRIFFSIILPLSGPIIAVMALFYGVGHWNEYFSAMIYISNRKMYPLQLILREILVKNQMAAASITNAATGNLESSAEQARIAEIVKYAVMIVATIPVLIVYPFVQKFFVKGMMVGAIKG